MADGKDILRSPRRYTINISKAAYTVAYQVARKRGKISTVFRVTGRRWPMKRREKKVSGGQSSARWLKSLPSWKIS